MADPLGTTLAILSVISMVTKSVVAFSKAIEDLRAHYKTMQDLWDELIALEVVLLSLHKAFESDPARFPLLAPPLKRCGQACAEFSLVIKRCTDHSDGSRPSIRDWATLKYMGSDISGFLRMLDGYKMTICIALETVNIGGSQVSVEHIEMYQEKISINVKALEEQLAEMNCKLESLTSGTNQNITSGTIERKQMLAEKASIQRLIDICLKASQYLESRQADLENTQNELNESELLCSAKRATTKTLEMCRKELTNTSTVILADIPLFPDVRNSPIAWAIPDSNTEKKRLQRELENERESVRRQLAFCVESKEFAEQKRQMIFERVSAGNQASQVIASKSGASIIARDIRIGDGTFQALGDLDAVTIQQTSQNHTAVLALQVIPSGITPEAKVDSSLPAKMTSENEFTHSPDQFTSNTKRQEDDIKRNKMSRQMKRPHGIRLNILNLMRSLGLSRSGSTKISLSST